MKTTAYILFKKIAYSLTGKGLDRIPGSSVLQRIVARVDEALKPGGTVLVECHGSKMFVNVDDEMVWRLLVNGVYEEFETELYMRLIRSDMVIVDIGANFGYYSLIGARLLNADGRVYAFEPEPHNHELLVKNIKINDYSNIIPVGKAISNRRGTNRLYTDKVNFGGHSFSTENILAGAGFVEVEAVTLDGFFKDVVGDSRVDLIKIDVQGAEGVVLEGAENLVTGNKGLKIFMEFWPAGLENVGTDPAELLRRMQGYGFHIKYIDESGRRLVDAGTTELIDICGSRSDGQVNLLLERG